MKVLPLFLAAIVLGGAGGYALFELFPTDRGSRGTVQAAAASNDVITGRASVIDGDTIDIHGTRIRLHGIDAPENDQTCVIGSEKKRCGQQASLALSDKIGEGTVSCDQRGRDRYGRVISVCHTNGEDLNAWMVENGWAMAYRHYSNDYVPQEEVAAAAGIGIWAGEFTPPWDWRKNEQPAAEKAKESSDCNIKGNISLNTGERIYHMPRDENYSKTRISTSKGERWFCSEAEARAAGWRRARR